MQEKKNSLEAKKEEEKLNIFRRIENFGFSKKRKEKLFLPE